MGFRKTTAALALVPLTMTGLAVGVAGAGPAGATAKSDPMFPIDFIVKASTHIAKLNQTITIPAGKFVGSLDLITGNLVGHITLPPASTTVSIGGIGLATVGFATAPVGPVTGHVNLAKLTLTSTTKFIAKIPYVHPLGAARQPGGQQLPDGDAGIGHVRGQGQLLGLDVLEHLHDPQPPELLAPHAGAQPAGSRAG